MDLRRSALAPSRANAPKPDSERFVIREVTFPAHGLPGVPPEVKLQQHHRVRIYSDQERTFTYLKYTTMHPHQKNMPAPKLYILSFEHEYWLKSVEQVVTKSGALYALREITPDELDSFGTQTKGCDIVFFEDRNSEIQLSVQQGMLIRKEGGCVVRQEAISYPEIRFPDLRALDQTAQSLSTGPGPAPLLSFNRGQFPVSTNMGPPPSPIPFPNMQSPPYVSSYPDMRRHQAPTPSFNIATPVVQVPFTNPGQPPVQIEFINKVPFSVPALSSNAVSAPMQFINMGQAPTGPNMALPLLPQRIVEDDVEMTDRNEAASTLDEPEQPIAGPLSRPQGFRFILYFSVFLYAFVKSGRVP